MLVPRWAAIFEKPGGAPGDIVRERIERIGVGSRVDLYVGGDGHYVEATVTACDVSTRMITVCYEDSDEEDERTEIVCIDSSRVWQYDTYTKVCRYVFNFLHPP